MMKQIVFILLLFLFLHNVPLNSKQMIFCPEDILTLIGIKDKELSLLDPLVARISIETENMDVLALEGYTYSADTPEELLTALYLNKKKQIPGVNWNTLENRFAAPLGAKKICYMWLLKGIRLNKRNEYILLVLNRVLPLVEQELDELEGVEKGRISKEQLIASYNSYINLNLAELFYGHSFFSLEGKKTTSEHTFHSYSKEAELLISCLIDYYLLRDYRDQEKAKEKLGLVLGVFRQKFSGKNQWYCIQTFAYTYLGKSFLNAPDIIRSLSKGQKLYIEQKENVWDSLK